MILKLSQFSGIKNGKNIPDPSKCFFVTNKLVSFYMLIHVFIYSNSYWVLAFYNTPLNGILYTWASFSCCMWSLTKAKNLPGKQKCSISPKAIKQIIQGKLWQLTTVIGSCGGLSNWLPILLSLLTILAKVHNQKKFTFLPTDFGLEGVTLFDQWKC